MMMSTSQVLLRSGTPAPLVDAIARTSETWSPPMQHLPWPVRFRASGALRAWQLALDSVEGLAPAKLTLSSPNVMVAYARNELSKTVSPHICFPSAFEARMSSGLRTVLRFSAHMLCFWLRRGALYEPTLALGALLGGSDIGQDLPVRYLAPPVPALCVLPPAQQHEHCGDSAAIMVFEQDAEKNQTPPGRTLMLISYKQSIDMQVDELTLPLDGGSDSLCQLVRYAIAESGPNYSARGFPSSDSVGTSQATWEKALDYLAKILLYLQLDQHAVRHDQPHSAAPKVFPGLGRRKREAKLTELEQLYDRYIVGPDALCDAAGTTAGAGLSAGHELPAHWRRGHFRLQAHGPQSSLRKLMFIPPTVVRADRLTSEPLAGDIPR